MKSLRYLIALSRIILPLAVLTIGIYNQEKIIEKSILKQHHPICGKDYDDDDDDDYDESDNSPI